MVECDSEEIEKLIRAQFEPPSYNQVLISWAAGFFDGEDCVNFAGKYESKRKQKIMHYCPQI